MSLNKMRAIKITIILSLFIFVIISFINLVLNTDRFHLISLELEGNVSHNDQDILSNIRTNYIIDRSLLAQLSVNNLFFWILGRDELFLNDRLLPSIKDISITTDVFKRGVNINILEKEVFGVICNENNCFVFDDNGVVFRRSPSITGTLIPKIYDPHNRPIVIGLPFLRDPSWFTDISVVINVLHDLDIGFTEIRLGNDQTREWEIDIISGPTIYFTFGSLPGDIRRVLLALSEEIDITSTEYIDLRVEGRIYYQ